MTSNVGQRQRARGGVRSEDDKTARDAEQLREALEQPLEIGEHHHHHRDIRVEKGGKKRVWKDGRGEVVREERVGQKLTPEAKTAVVAGLLIAGATVAAVKTNLEDAPKYPKLKPVDSARLNFKVGEEATDDTHFDYPDVIAKTKEGSEKPVEITREQVPERQLNRLSGTDVNLNLYRTQDGRNYVLVLRVKTSEEAAAVGEDGTSFQVEDIYVKPARYYTVTPAKPEEVTSMGIEDANACTINAPKGGFEIGLTRPTHKIHIGNPIAGGQTQGDNVRTVVLKVEPPPVDKGEVDIFTILEGFKVHGERQEGTETSKPDYTWIRGVEGKGGVVKDVVFATEEPHTNALIFYPPHFGSGKEIPELPGGTLVMAALGAGLAIKMAYRRWRDRTA